MDSNAAADRLIAVEGHYLVMFKHPAQGPNGSWRVWRRAETGDQAELVLREARAERPSYEFRLAIKHSRTEWADE